MRPCRPGGTSCVFRRSASSSASPPHHSSRLSLGCSARWPWRRQRPAVGGADFLRRLVPYRITLLPASGGLTVRRATFPPASGGNVERFRNGYPNVVAGRCHSSGDVLVRCPSPCRRSFLLVRLGCRGARISPHNPKVAGSNPACA